MIQVAGENAEPENVVFRKYRFEDDDPIFFPVATTNPTSCKVTFPESSSLGVRCDER